MNMTPSCQGMTSCWVVIADSCNGFRVSPSLRTYEMTRINLGTLLLTVLACVQALSSHAQPLHPVGQDKPLVLLISLDGFKPSYISQRITPNLFGLAQQGAQAQGLISAFPSLTFPNHLTLVTGQTPDHHGIVNNTKLCDVSRLLYISGTCENAAAARIWPRASPPCRL